VREPVYLKIDDPPSKRRILQTALRLFAQQGVETVTVRQIADGAGYTNPALFKFFATKDALALYLFESCYVALFERLKVAIEGKAAYDDQFAGVLGAFFAQLEEDLDAFLFVQDNLRRMWPRVSPATREKSILSVIRRVLEQGIREGAVPESNTGLLVAAVTGTLQQFARMLHFGEFKGKASDWGPELGKIIRRMVAA
jgi:TetR/AcrR family transcriptional regulator, repressor of fatR-cypB operon